MNDISKCIETMNKLQDTINSPTIQAGQNTADIIATSQTIMQYPGAYETLNVLSSQMSQYNINIDTISSVLSSMTSFTNHFYEQEQLISNITQALHPILDGYTILSLHPKDRKEEQKDKADHISEKVISEIYLPDEKKIITNESPTITIMPANNKVFAYLADHPEELYNCTPREFEEFMAQLYNKLGYEAELTKATKDGGKDIILRKPDILGDMVYYVECKRYNKKNSVSIDIIREFTGVIEIDKVNGGIIATTSFFSRDAKDWIIEKDLNYKIQMHDFNTIKNMLKKL